MADPKSTSKLPFQAPKTALDTLRAGSSQRLLQHAQWLASVDQQLRPHLPFPLQAHARLTNIRDGALIFLVDAAIWHQKLRMIAPELLATAQNMGLNVSHVQIKMQIAPPMPLPSAQRSPLSTTGKAAIAEVLSLLRDDQANESAGR